MNIVLDACAMIAYLHGEPGRDIVRDHLADPANIPYAHVLNICEVYYDFVRRIDEVTASAAVADLRRVGLRTKRIMSERFWRRAGQLKGTVRRVSIADCFAITLANELDATVLTSDHHEFDAIAQQGICRVTFIR
jgi:predicted nucleic acid-binding protein